MYIHGGDVTFVESRTRNLITLWKLAKSLQNFVQDSFPIKLTTTTKNLAKTGKMLLLGPL